MKFFGLIFSFYLLFLAIEPGISSLTHPEETEACCSSTSCQPVEDQPEPKPEKQGCNDTNTCNPFQTCSNYTAFVSDLLHLDFSSAETYAKPYTQNKDKVPPSIALDFWQPPKIG
ncbi:MAG TPA: hypothetical protein VD996_13700 [Chitinophagaceae bacterium]|nr:hypothetical protein [Chitinophagaceae bacterium]